METRGEAVEYLPPLVVHSRDFSRLSGEAMLSMSIWHWLIVLIVVIAIFRTNRLHRTNVRPLLLIRFFPSTEEASRWLESEGAPLPERSRPA